MKVCCYLLGCEKTGAGLIIDPGGEESRILDIAEKSNLHIEAIVNTHGHPDHTCGNAGIKAVTSAKIYIHVLDDLFFTSPESVKTRKRLGYSPAPPSDVTVIQGDKIFFGHKSLTVIHTPGHTPGSICLLMGNHCFTGDTLFVGSVGRTDFPGGSPNSMQDSIYKKIAKLSGDTIVWPGHHYGNRLSSTIADEMIRLRFSMGAG
ncbi:MBL fold metallo-hydrolase [Desulfotignum balticum]|nr:MBL fold metallo-hydrolase [Desulfotignum balticum]